MMTTGTEAGEPIMDHYAQHDCDCHTYYINGYHQDKSLQFALDVILAIVKAGSGLGPSPSLIR